MFATGLPWLRPGPEQSETWTMGSVADPSQYDRDVVPSMADRIRDFKASPIGQAQAHYRAAPPKIWQDYDPIPGLGGTTPAQIKASGFDLPERAAKELLWGGPADAAIGLGLGKTATSFLPPQAQIPARIGLTAAGAFGKLLEPAEAAPRDPRLFHGISAIKLPKPVSEYFSRHSERAPMVGKTFDLAELQGKRLLPTVGDTTVPNTYLEQIEAYKLPERVKMGGGGRFADVEGNNPDVWMSAQTLAQGLVNKSDEIARKTGADVLTVPTALSGTGGDYSHHVWSPLVDVLKDTKGISKSAREEFDTAMREAAPDFPGINARRDTLQRYFQQAPRTPRTSFAQIMDSRRFQDLGFPDVAAVRHAATDPELLHAPMGSSGYSVFRINPQQIVHPSTSHGTYSHGITGQNVGSMGVIAPPELVFPDVMDSLRKMSQASGKPLNKYINRPDYYFAGKIPPTLKGEPLAQSQLVDDKWINRMGDYAQRYNKVGGAAALAAGMTLAEIAQARDAGKMGDTADPSRYND